MKNARQGCYSNSFTTGRTRGSKNQASCPEGPATPGVSHLAATSWGVVQAVPEEGKGGIPKGLTAQ